MALAAKNVHSMPKGLLVEKRLFLIFVHYFFFTTHSGFHDGVHFGAEARALCNGGSDTLVLHLTHNLFFRGAVKGMVLWISILYISMFSLMFL